MQKFSNRKFGVEIECIGMTEQQIIKLFKENNIPVTGYSDKYSKWSVKDDGSIETNDFVVKITKCFFCKNSYNLNCFMCNGTKKRIRRIPKSAEVVSPILSGIRGLKQLEKVVNLMKENGITVNKTCGLHVHVYAKDYKKIELLNVFHRYSNFEKTIDKWIKNDRRKNNNNFCCSTNSESVSRQISLNNIFDELSEKNIKSIKEKINILYNVVIKNKINNNEEKRIANIVTDTYFSIDRQCKLNLSSYFELGTVEFRHHHGSVDPTEIKNWVMFCVQFFEQSVKKEQPKEDLDSIYLGISPDVKRYFSKFIEKSNKKSVKRIIKKR